MATTTWAVMKQTKYSSNISLSLRHWWTLAPWHAMLELSLLADCSGRRSGTDCTWTPIPQAAGSSAVCKWVSSGLGGPISLTKDWIRAQARATPYLVFWRAPWSWTQGSGDCLNHSQHSCTPLNRIILPCSSDDRFHYDEQDCNRPAEAAFLSCPASENTSQEHRDRFPEVTVLCS